MTAISPQPSDASAPRPDPAGHRLVVPDPPLTDGVVVLRPWLDDDVEQVDAACQDPGIQRYIPVPRPYRRSDAVAYVARTRRQWADDSKAAFAIADAAAPHRLLGAVNLAVSGAVGNSAYWIVPTARGCGVASRALGLLTDWAFHTLDLGVVLLEIDSSNDASRAVAARAGYHQAGLLSVNAETGERGHLLFSRLAG